MLLHLVFVFYFQCALLFCSFALSISTNRWSQMFINIKHIKNNLSIKTYSVYKIFFFACCKNRKWNNYSMILYTHISSINMLVILFVQIIFFFTIFDGSGNSSNHILFEVSEVFWKYVMTKCDYVIAFEICSRIRVIYHLRFTIYMRFYHKTTSFFFNISYFILDDEQIQWKII